MLDLKLNIKKREICFGILVLWFYARFVLSISTVAMAIAMIMAIAAAAVYVIRSPVVAAEGSVVCTGVDVAIGACATFAYVCDHEAPYELLPPKVADIW